MLPSFLYLILCGTSHFNFLKSTILTLPLLLFLAFLHSQTLILNLSLSLNYPPLWFSLRSLYTFYLLSFLYPSLSLHSSFIFDSLYNPHLFPTTPCSLISNSILPLFLHCFSIPLSFINTLSLYPPSIPTSLVFP